MKKFKILVPFLLTALLLVSCGNKAATGADETTASTSSEASVSTESSVSLEIVEMDDTTSTSEEEPDAGMVSPYDNLTDIELDYFTEYFQKMENYGFLLSTYADVKDVDLEEVFHNGAGYDREVSDEEVQAYLDYFGYEELYTGLMVVPADYLENVIKKNTGYSYNELNSYLSYYWYYNSSTQCYYYATGDTNYCPYKAVEGYHDDSLYIIRAKNVYREMAGLTDYFHQFDREVVLEKTDDGFKFVSCRNLIDENLLIDNAYNLVVPYYGEVNIMVYAPEQENTDITIMMLKDGEPITYFYWDGNYDNILEGMTFDHIVDMGFSDYNNDGFADMAMSICYIKDSGEEYYQLRVYTGEQYGYLYQSKDEAQDCYACVSNTSTTKDIRTPVMFDLLSSNYNKVEEEWKPAYIEVMEKEEDDEYFSRRYLLFYLDDNYIFEILKEGAGEAEGNLVMTNYNGKVTALRTDRLYYLYQDKTGLFDNCDGISGFNYDMVYKLEKGMFNLIFEGTYEVDLTQDTEDYTYYISGNEVSETEYKEKLNTVFDKNSGWNLGSEYTRLTKDEMLRLLNCDVRKIFD